MRARTWLLLAAPLALAGCNLLVVGSMIAPDAPVAPPAHVARTFALGQVVISVPAEALAPEAVPTAPPEPVAEAAAPVATVRLVGRALVAADAVGIANVHGGYVAGTPITVIEAHTGRRLAAGTTYFDGSFAVDVPLGRAKVSAIVGTELFGSRDRADRAVLSAPVNLHVGDLEKRVVVTPGSTALTHFLRRLAAGMEADRSALPDDPPDLAALVGPRFGSLVAGIEDDEREGFARLAESSDELRAANNLARIRAGIDGFASKFTAAPAR